MNRANKKFACIVLTAVLAAGCSLTGDDPQTEQHSFDPDLEGWTMASWTPFTVKDTISGFAYAEIDGKDVFVAVSSGGVIAYSNDGTIWEHALEKKQIVEPGTPPKITETIGPLDESFTNYHAVAVSDDGVFIAVGNGGRILYSSDGVIWTRGPSAGIAGFGSENIYGIAYGKIGTAGYFVAVGANTNISCSSDKGLTWAGGSAAADFNNDTTIQFNDICYGNGVFYVVGDSGWTGYSNNPAGTWNNYLYNVRDYSLSEKDDPGYPFFGNTIRRVVFGKYGSGTGIGVSFDEWGGRRMAVILTSDFARNQHWDADLDAGYFGNNGIYGIAYANNYFVAGGDAAMLGYWPSAQYETDRYWRVLSLLEFNYWRISVIAACKDRFFAGGDGGKIAYSK
jgi:hypothetical protein